MHRVVHMLLALAFLCAANLHLPLMQVAAWTGMLVSYSQGRSFVEAAEMTFDGEHPCPMCKAIEKQQEQQSTLKRATSSPNPIYILFAPRPWIQHLNLLAILSDNAVSVVEIGTLPQRMPPRTVA